MWGLGLNSGFGLGFGFRAWRFCGLGMIWIEEHGLRHLIQDLGLRLVSGLRDDLGLGFWM